MKEGHICGKHIQHFRKLPVIWLPVYTRHDRALFCTVDKSAPECTESHSNCSCNNQANPEGNQNSIVLQTMYHLIEILMTVDGPLPIHKGAHEPAMMNRTSCDE